MSEQKKGGRKPLPPEQKRSERFEMRVTPADKNKIERNGGAPWVESLVRRARDKPPPKTET